MYSQYRAAMSLIVPKLTTVVKIGMTAFKSEDATYA